MVYPGAFFKSPWNVHKFETIAFEPGIGSKIGAPYISSNLFGYFQLTIK